MIQQMLAIWSLAPLPFLNLACITESSQFTENCWSLAHSSTLAWKIPWMEKPGGLQSMGSQRVRHDWATSLSHASKVMLKILQARLQEYMNCELPDVQAGFRKGRENKDQIANIHWIIEKARVFQKNIYSCFIDYTKAFNCVDHNKLWKILQEMGMPDHLTCLLRNLYAGQEAS